MKIPKEELIAIMSQFNPWWRKEAIPDLPTWRRAAFNELLAWILQPPAPRAVLLSGPRQVGKTTLLLQAIDSLLKEGTPPTNILYATFDHPVFKLAGLDAVLEAWRELEPRVEGAEYLFLDEAQFIRDFGTWTKHQVDFTKHRRIVFTGSAMPLANSNQESGVGRWHMLRISTLSFYEYLQIKKISLPDIPIINSLSTLFEMNSSEMHRHIESTRTVIGHFHEYLIRGGFPQTALVESVSQSQRLLREDIIDKVLKRDMTAIFGVRRILELEQMFIFLCMHDGGQQDLQSLASNLGVSKPTVQSFIELFESTHLLYRLPPFGYGKEVLRARYKLYLADAAISSAILMKGKTILEHADALGRCVETCVFAHLSSHSSLGEARFSYWQNIKTKEVDLIVEIGERFYPFEVKYQSQFVHENDILALIEFCQKKSILSGYVLTKEPQDIGPLKGYEHIMRIPAALFCYWLGKAELSQTNLLSHKVNEK
jgi:uncharacterized protein